MLILYVFILVAALIGLSITFSIFKKKHTKQPLVCPFGADCNTVIHGKFSTFLGVGLEVYGGMYYALILLVYLAFILFPAVITPWTMFFVTGATIGAFLFSLYLTFVQAFYIKSWCSWCLMSAGVSTAIFIFTMIELSILPISIVPIIATLGGPILFMHLIGFALGVGGATISDVLFFKFLRDFKISEKEQSVLSIMSQVIWVGLLLAVISGIGLYIPEAAALHESSKFLLKTIVIGVIIVNGAFLNLYISPKLLDLGFKENGLNVRQASRLRHLAFALGAVSFISWYTAAFLGFIESAPFTLLELLGIYIGLLLIGIVGSQIVERTLCKSAAKVDPHQL